MIDNWRLVEFFDDPEPEPERDWLDHITSGDWDPRTARAGYLTGYALTVAVTVVFVLSVVWAVTQ